MRREGTAVCKAVSEGHMDFIRLAVAAKSDDYCVPCGTCRQVLHEFAPDLRVLCANRDGEYVRYRVRELLPHGFELKK